MFSSTFLRFYRLMNTGNGFASYSKPLSIMIQRGKNNTSTIVSNPCIKEWTGTKEELIKLGKEIDDMKLTQTLMLRHIEAMRDREVMQQQEMLRSTRKN